MLSLSMSFTKLDIFKKLEIIGVQDKNELDIGYTALLLANLDLPKNSFEQYQDELNLIASDLSAIPGPLLPVTPIAPP